MDAHKMMVKCGVDTCYYNEKHMCQADGLEVNSMGDGKAQSADGTCCTTFENRNGMS